MERLTERNPLGIDDEMWVSACEPDDEEIEAVYHKLKEYEDLEEQGRLIRLPCKVGDTVYKLVPNLCRKYVETKIAKFIIDKNEIYFITDRGASWNIDKIGKTAFLAEAEAEAKLKELRGNQNGKV